MKDLKTSLFDEQLNPIHDCFQKIQWRDFLRGGTILHYLRAVMYSMDITFTRIRENTCLQNEKQ